jgi:hypothetical protein
VVASLVNDFLVVLLDILAAAEADGSKKGLRIVLRKHFPGSDCDV